MCFRPSAVAGDSGNQIQMGECPNCHQPVAASVGITGGVCPHCGKPIVPNVKDKLGSLGADDPNANNRFF